MTAVHTHYTEDELRTAYRSVKGRGWPAFELAMEDPMRHRLIVFTAWRKSHLSQDPAPSSTPTQRECDIPIPMPAMGLRPTPALFDHKRAAAGDRDE